jgi:hypothetical protein
MTSSPMRETLYRKAAAITGSKTREAACFRDDLVRSKRNSREREERFASANLGTTGDITNGGADSDGHSC